MTATPGGDGLGSEVERAERVRQLVQQLAETQAELSTLTNGADLVLDPRTGTPILLQEAQAHMQALLEQVQAGRARLQALSRHLVAVQEAERQNISRELHDETSQSMTALKLGLALLRREVAGNGAAEARVAELIDKSDSILDGLHRLAVNLRPVSLDRYGLLPALEQYIAELQNTAGLQVDLAVVGMGRDRLPGEVEIALYRIVQEALTNVVRHSGASRAALVLEREGDLLRLILEDRGHGFDVEEALGRGRLGLVGMLERAEMLDGGLTIESTPEGGTTVFVEVPLSASTSASSIGQKGGRGTSLQEMVPGATAHTPAEVEQAGAAPGRYAEASSYLAAELDAVLSSIVDGLVVYDLEGRVVRMNAVAEEMLGYGSEVRGASIEERSVLVTHPRKPDGTPYAVGDVPAVRALRGEIIRNEEMILHVPAQGGRDLRVLVSSAPIRSQGGAVTGCVTTFTDVHRYYELSEQLRQARDELEHRVQEQSAELRQTSRDLSRKDAALSETVDILRYQSELLRSIMDHSPDCIYVKDTDSRFITTNAEHLKLIGAASLEDVLGKTDLDIFPRELAEKYVADEREVMRTGRPLLNREERVIDGQGGEHWVLTSKVPLYNGAREIVGLLGVTRDVSERRKIEEALRASREQLQALARRQIEVQERERSFVANQLYNEAAQVLAALKIQSSLLEQELADGQVLPERLAEVRETADRVLREMHHLALTLRPVILDQLGLAAAVEQYLLEFGKEHNLKVQFEGVAIENLPLSPDAATALYRLVQEALGNVAIHSRASSVGIVMSRVNERLSLLIEDDGVGFDLESAARGGALGLLSMRQRAEGLGGCLSIETSPGAGTSVIAEVPLNTSR